MLTHWCSLHGETVPACIEQLEISSSSKGVEQTIPGHWWAAAAHQIGEEARLPDDRALHAAALYG